MSIENVKGFISQSQSTNLSQSQKSSHGTNEVTAKAKTITTDTTKANNDKLDNARSEADEGKILKAIESANRRMKIQNTKCEFSYHETTKRVSIKVIDENTEEVIKEIPPEKTLEMIEKMWELAGIILDERR